jgi:hypothetical protein
MKYLGQIKAGVEVCRGSVECAHVKSKGAGGDDRGNCVPLCSRHHRHQHDLGIYTFQRRYGIDLPAVAQKLNEVYHDPDAAW